MAQKSPLAFMRKTRRKRQTLRDRQIPCRCCGYPISHRHHLFPISEWGEGGITVQLCPNCHELYHIVADVVKQVDSNVQILKGRSASLLVYLGTKWTIPDPKITYLVELAREAFKAQEETRRAEENTMREMEEVTFDMIFDWLPPIEGEGNDYEDD